MLLTWLPLHVMHCRLSDVLDHDLLLTVCMQSYNFSTNKVCKKRKCYVWEEAFITYSILKLKNIYYIWKYSNNSFENLNATLTKKVLQDGILLIPSQINLNI